MSLDRIFRRPAPTLKAQRGEPVGHPSRKVSSTPVCSGLVPVRPDFSGDVEVGSLWFLRRGLAPASGKPNSLVKEREAGASGLEISSRPVGLQDLSVESAAGAGALSPRHECRGPSRFLVVMDTFGQGRPILRSRLSLCQPRFRPTYLRRRLRGGFERPAAKLPPCRRVPFIKLSICNSSTHGCIDPDRNTCKAGIECPQGARHAPMTV
jgi:hypothetical protein